MSFFPPLTSLLHICSGAQCLSVKHESLIFELTAAHLESCLARKCNSNPIGWSFSKSFPYWAIRKLAAKVSVSTSGSWESQWFFGEEEAGADNRMCQCFKSSFTRNNKEHICTLLIQIHPADHIHLCCLPRTHANTHANTHTHSPSMSAAGTGMAFIMFEETSSTLAKEQRDENRNIYSCGCGTVCVHMWWSLVCFLLHRNKIVLPTSTAVIPVSFHLCVESSNRSEWQRHEIENRETKTVRRRERAGEITM